MKRQAFDPVGLFSMYMKVTGVPTLEDAPAEDPALAGKKLGIINGSSWITLWSNYFARKMLPGVKLINVGNEATQLNFMAAHAEHRPTPPQINIDMFVRYAEDLVALCDVDAIIITCSTMNRSAAPVREAMRKHGVPVVQIDEAMIEQGVAHGGRILVVATHGPTVRNTQLLLEETAGRAGKEVSFAAATVEEAFELLGQGDIHGHNEAISGAIRRASEQQDIGIVVLAQLSMSVFKLSYPDCVKQFGVDVLTSAETGFARAAEVLRQVKR